MAIRVQAVRFYRVPMKTRFPFRYGIASLTELPHLLVICDVEIDGRRSTGISADGLAPKWFTKDPATSFEDDDLPAMQTVIRHAADVALAAGTQADFFAWWQVLHREQSAWAGQNQIAPLLSGLGCSLLERAVIDAFCRHHQRPFHELLRANALGIRLGDMRSELTGLQPADVLPNPPLSSVAVRHTVGLADPLTDQEIPHDQQLDDGLPHSLAAAIQAYGLRYFKVKLSGDLAGDHERLRRLVEVFQQEVGADYRFTLDGNENYPSVAAFREHWEHHRQHAPIRE
ncbi:MAG: hypothetical protein KDA85_21870, partial [Planctomycetaceae bacterium]|nr:hypothetical protein [Planctomycetaceae bacterium]